MNFLVDDLDSWYTHTALFRYSHMRSRQFQGIVVVMLVVVAVVLERSVGSTGSSRDGHNLVLSFDQTRMADSKLSGRKHLCKDETKDSERHLNREMSTRRPKFRNYELTGSDIFINLDYQVTQQT